MSKRLGDQTVSLPSAPRFLSWAAVVGKKEGEGPLKKGFDAVSEDSYFGEESWEKAESRMIRRCFCSYVTISERMPHILSEHIIQMI